MNKFASFFCVRCTKLVFRLHIYCRILSSSVYIVFTSHLYIIGPVWYNFPTTSEANNNASSSSDDPPILKRGVVQSVSLDILTREMLYKVVYKQNDNDKVIEDEVSDKELAFGSNCPVFISAAEEENDENNNNPSETKKNSGQEEGTVLYCEQSPIGFVYTVMIFMEGSKARYEEGVMADRIKYRTVNVNTDEATKEEKQQQSKVSAVSTNEVAVPSSITLGKREDGGIVAEPNKKMKLSVEDGSSTQGSHSQKKMDMPASTGKGKVHDDTDHGTRIDITVPLFLQRDRTMQKTLFSKSFMINALTIFILQLSNIGNRPPSWQRGKQKGKDAEWCICDRQGDTLRH